MDGKSGRLPYSFYSTEEQLRRTEGDGKPKPRSYSEGMKPFSNRLSYHLGVYSLLHNVANCCKTFGNGKTFTKKKQEFLLDTFS